VVTLEQPVLLDIRDIPGIRVIVVIQERQVQLVTPVTPVQLVIQERQVQLVTLVIPVIQATLDTPVIQVIQDHPDL
jgi:hypothetical protein